MAEAAQRIIPITTPNRSFECHKDIVTAVAVFPDGRRMATSSTDQTIRLWDLKDGVVLKEMEGHGNWVRAVAVSRDGQLIASGDNDGKLIVWHGDTGEYS
jgi:WD40 repeat protein